MIKIQYVFSKWKWNLKLKYNLKAWIFYSVTNNFCTVGFSDISILSLWCSQSLRLTELSFV